MRLMRNERVLWAAGIGLALFAGMAIMNDRANQTALDDAYWQCHLALQSALKRPQDKPPMLSETSP